jgi:hypothetical protein
MGNLLLMLLWIVALTAATLIAGGVYMLGEYIYRIFKGE